MKKKCVILLVLCSILLFSACQETPQEVKENMKRYGDETKQVQETEMTYCKPDQVGASVERAKKLSLQNLKLPEKIDLSYVKELYTLNMQVPSGFSKYADEIAKLNGLKIPKWEKNEGNYNGDSALIYDDEEKSGVYIVAMENGTFIASTLKGISLSEDVRLIKRIYGENDKECKQSVKLDGEYSTVKSEIEATEREVRNRYRRMLPNLEFSVANVWIYDKKDGNQRLEMMGKLKYKGVPYYHFCASAKEQVCTVCSSLYLISEKKGKVQFVAFNDANFDNMTRKSIDKVVDYPSAVKLAEKKLSGFKPYEIDKVEVLYYPTACLDSKDKMRGSATPMFSGMKINAKPVYAFIIYAKKASVENEDVITYDINSTGVILVDMLTGEVSVELENLKR